MYFDYFEEFLDDVEGSCKRGDVLAIESARKGAFSEAEATSRISVDKRIQ
jgi:hypothetical protein